MGKVTTWRTVKLGTGETANVVQVEQPVRAPSLEADYLVPVAVGLTTGLVLGTAAAVAIILLWHTVWWPTWGAALAICSGLGWMWARSDLSSSLYRTESMTVDALPTSPAQASAPPDRAPMLLNAAQARQELHISQADAERTQRQDELVDFYRLCFVRGTSEGAHNVKASDRKTFVGKREALIALGLAERTGTSKNSAWRLTTTPALARAVIRRHVA